MSYDVKVNRQGLSALFDLKGDQAAVRAWISGALADFPERRNRMTVGHAAAIYYIGRNHWLLRAEIKTEDALTAQLKPDAAPMDISIVRVSDTLTFFDITGPDSDQILAIASPLDIHPSVFGDDCVTFTTAFGIKALILRCAGGFELAIEQSFADYFADCCTRASCQPVLLAQ